MRDERLSLTMWMDANAPYHDTFVNKRPTATAYDLAQDRELLASLKGIHERRCASCHTTDTVTRLDWIDIHQADRELVPARPLGEVSRRHGEVRTSRLREHRRSRLRIDTSAGRRCARSRVGPPAARSAIAALAPQTAGTYGPPAGQQAP